MKQLRITAGIGALLALAACGSGNQTATLTKSGLNPEKFKAEFKAIQQLSTPLPMKPVLKLVSLISAEDSCQ